MSGKNFLRKFLIHCISLIDNNEFEEFGLDANIVQINNSMNKNKGTLRGLHFQRPPKAETMP